jgi:hypothetical protein
MIHFEKLLDYAENRFLNTRRRVTSGRNVEATASTKKVVKQCENERKKSSSTRPVSTTEKSEAEGSKN